MMTYLYLRHRPSPSSGWTLPLFTTAFPAAPVNAMPVADISIESGPHIATPCGCPADSTDDNYLILRATLPAIPLAEVSTILPYLLVFKTDAYREAKMTRFGNGNFMTSDLSLLVSQEANGMATISFRLAATVADAIA